MRDTRLGGVGIGAAQFLHRHILVGDRLHHVRTCHEHIGRSAHHVREVRYRRRIDGPSGARTEYRRNLRYHARSQGVAQEYFRVPAEGNHALLDARTTRVVEPNDRCAVPHRKVHDLHDFFGESLRKRPAKDREVLREDVDESTVDLAVPGDHAITIELLRFEPEIGRAMDDEAVQFDERAFVQKKLESLAGR